jgi:hypothetical protein
LAYLSCRFYDYTVLFSCHDAHSIFGGPKCPKLEMPKH